MTDIQQLLDKEANLSNRRYHILKQIKALRGNEPRVCWGLDDCSTNFLAHCPWRIDCGEHESQEWQNKQSNFS